MSSKPYFKKFFLPLFSLLLVAALLSGCSGSAKNTYQEAASSTAAMAPEAAPMEEPAAMYDTADEANDNDYGAGAADAETGTGSGGAILPQDARKIVITGDMEMESKQFNKTCSDIRAAVAMAGGYIQSSQLNANYGAYGEQMAYYSIRVPATGYSAFADSVAELGNVRSRNESSDDITSQYVDVEARLVSLRAQEKWLLDFMEQAKKMEDMLEIERQITEVQYQIESYTSQMRQMDQMTTYSTLNVWVYEVKELSQAVTVQETFGQRISRAASDSWQAAGRFFQDLAVFLVTILPGLLVLGVVLAIVLILVFRAKKRARREAEKMRATAPPFAPPSAPMAPPASMPAQQPAAPQGTAEPSGHNEAKK